MLDNKIHELKLADINYDEEFNCRGKLAPIDVVDLAKDIERNGLIQPVTVAMQTADDQKKTGKIYKLIAGYRRFMAHLILKKETILCAVHLTVLNDVEARIINLSENLHRRELNILQEAKAIARLQEYGIGEHMAAEKLGQSRGWVQVRFMLLKLPEEIQMEASAGTLSQTHIRELSTVYRKFGKDKAFELTRKIKDSKLKGVKLSVNPKVLSNDSKRVRKRVELLILIDAILDTFGSNIGARCLAWAAGEISNNELYEDLNKLATEQGYVFKAPDYSIQEVEVDENGDIRVQGAAETVHQQEQS
jgi:ParB/RepB/Spo0J family partition protein